MTARTGSRAPAALLALTAALCASTGLLPLAGGTAGAAAVPAPAAASASAAPTVSTVNGCVSSKPEPGTSTPVKICYSLFKPSFASSTHKVPVVMHGHGWGGSRTTDPAAFTRFFNHGYAVMSFDQRGFGASGGKAHVMNPGLEGVDIQRLVAMLARQRWIKKDGPGDPRLGAIGGSYGGGYQFLGAFKNLTTRGKPVFDALAPEITWNDLSHTLAPSGVPRTEWLSLLVSLSLPSDALQPYVQKAFLEGVAAGTWPDGSGVTGADMGKYLRRNGPAWQVSQGRRLDIPVLFRQGETDTLFPLQQGLANWATALTESARRRSMFIGYNGGHVLPAALPPSTNPTDSLVSGGSDPCSKQLAGGDFQALTLRFFDEKLRGRDTGLRGYGRFHLATPGGACVNVASVRANTSLPVESMTSTTAVGVPLAHQVTRGPITVAGTPYLTGKVTTLGPEARSFFALAVGSSVADAKVVQSNVMPLREPTQVTDVSRRIALPSVTVRVPAGKNLYVMSSPYSEQFAGTSSRTPGVVVVDGAVVHLPVVR